MLMLCFQKGDPSVGQGAEGTEGVTDVIQQLLELSDHVAADGAQDPPTGQTIETSINQDILQVTIKLHPAGYLYGNAIYLFHDCRVEVGLYSFL